MWNVWNVAHRGEPQSVWYASQIMRGCMNARVARMLTCARCCQQRHRFPGDEDPELDDDITEDPLFKLDRKGAIVESMKLFATVPAAAQQLFPLLSQPEQATIKKALQ